MCEVESMRKEIQGIFLFLVFQNILFVGLWVLGYSSPLGQAIGSIIIGGILYWYLEHEERIKEHLTEKDPARKVNFPETFVAFVNKAMVWLKEFSKSYVHAIEGMKK
jgi:hypothetical protein